MDKSNHERMLIRIIKELTAELHLDVVCLSHDWVIRILNKTAVRHIFGYDWELNTSTAQQIAKDKSACYELLQRANVPALLHRMFIKPDYQHYLNSTNIWDDIKDFAQSHDYNVVIKPNAGTGGEDVLRVKNWPELEAAARDLFTRHRTISLSPFIVIQDEYRVIILDDAVQLIYRKQRPVVIGNGRDTVATLMQEQGYVAKESITHDAAHDIVPRGKEIQLDWKHNLSKGAKALIEPQQKERDQKLSALALQAARAIQIRFASVDIVVCDGELRVLEINAGIMMENFARQGDVEYNLAKAIYKNAIITMMAQS
jgi:glutathione synthase/RimK-type ligase-like ATP-grasp enzyme